MFNSHRNWLFIFYIRNLITLYSKLMHLSIYIYNYVYTEINWRCLRHFRRETHLFTITGTDRWIYCNGNREILKRDGDLLNISIRYHALAVQNTTESTTEITLSACNHRWGSWCSTSVVCELLACLRCPGWYFVLVDKFRWGNEALWKKTDTSLGMTTTCIQIK